MSYDIHPAGPNSCFDGYDTDPIDTCRCDEDPCVCPPSEPEEAGETNFDDCVLANFASKFVWALQRPESCPECSAEEF